MSRARTARAALIAIGVAFSLCASAVDFLERKDFEAMLRSLNLYGASTADARARLTAKGFSCIQQDYGYFKVICFRTIRDRACSQGMAVHLSAERDDRIFDVDPRFEDSDCAASPIRSRGRYVDRSNEVDIGCDMETFRTKARRRYLFVYYPDAPFLHLMPRRHTFDIEANTATNLRATSRESFRDFPYDHAVLSFNPLSRLASLNYIRADNVIIDAQLEQGECKLLARSRDYDYHPIEWVRGGKAVTQQSRP